MERFIKRCRKDDDGAQAVVPAYHVDANPMDGALDDAQAVAPKPKSNTAEGTQDDAQVVAPKSKSKKSDLRFNRKVQCTFQKYSEKDASGVYKKLKDAVNVENNPAREFAETHGEAASLSCAGFMLAHSAWRRYLGSLQRDGDFDAFEAEVSEQGCVCTVDIVAADKAQKDVLVSARRWAEYTNVVRDMSVSHGRVARAEKSYALTDDLPQVSGIGVAMVTEKIHDIMKPERRGDPQISDPMANAMLDCWVAMPCFESRVATVHITTLSRSTCMLQRLAELSPRIASQQDLDDFIVDNAAYHKKPRNSDYETKCCMPVVGHPHYMGRDFGNVLHVLYALSDDTDLQAASAKVRKAINKAGEFLISHYLFNLFWASEVGGVQESDSIVGRRLVLMFRALYSHLQSKKLRFAVELTNLISKQNTTAFANAFLQTPKLVEVPSYVKNTMRNARIQHTEGAVATFFQDVYGHLHTITWPVSVTITAAGRTKKFAISRSLANAFNVLVLACMCERVRKRMAEVGWD